MTLIAKWNLNEGPGEDPTTAIDDSGHPNSHNGSYVHSSGYGLRPGGSTPSRRCFYANGNSRVDSIGNPADLRLSGEMTVSVWAEPHAATAIFGSCGVNSELEADNYLWMVGCSTAERLRFFWETGVGVDVDVFSNTSVRKANFLWQQFGFIRRLFGAGPNLEVEFIVNGVSVGIKDNSGAGYSAPTGGGNAVPRVGSNAELNSGDTLLSIVRVWDEARTPAQLLTDYNTELSILQGMPVNYAGEYNPNTDSGWK